MSLENLVSFHYCKSWLKTREERSCLISHLQFLYSWLLKVKPKILYVGCALLCPNKRNVWFWQIIKSLLFAQKLSDIGDKERMMWASLCINDVLWSLSLCQMLRGSPRVPTPVPILPASLLWPIFPMGLMNLSHWCHRAPDVPPVMMRWHGPGRTPAHFIDN